MFYNAFNDGLIFIIQSYFVGLLNFRILKFYFYNIQIFHYFFFFCLSAAYNLFFN